MKGIVFNTEENGGHVRENSFLEFKGQILKDIRSFGSILDTKLLQVLR
jgi:hypothetical protein